MGTDLFSVTQSKTYITFFSLGMHDVLSQRAGVRISAPSMNIVKFTVIVVSETGHIELALMHRLIMEKPHLDWEFLFVYIVLGGTRREFIPSSLLAAFCSQRYTNANHVT